CCQNHDWCFLRIIRSGVCGRDEPYHKNYDHNGLKCNTGLSSSRCGQAICGCDVAAVKCFMRTLKSFNNRFKNYNKSTC
ncbi:hypothetical protein QZH41_011023, partial [Actinostola sp. cb2023]